MLTNETFILKYYQNSFFSDVTKIICVGKTNNIKGIESQSSKKKSPALHYFPLSILFESEISNIIQVKCFVNASYYCVLILGFTHCLIPLQIIPNFFPPLEGQVRQGVFNSLNFIMEKRVLALVYHTHTIITISSYSHFIKNVTLLVSRCFVI